MLTRQPPFAGDGDKLADQPCFAHPSLTAQQDGHPSRVR